MCSEKKFQTKFELFKIIRLYPYITVRKHPSIILFIQSRPSPKLSRPSPQLLGVLYRPEPTGSQRCERTAMMIYDEILGNGVSNEKFRFLQIGWNRAKKKFHIEGKSVTKLRDFIAMEKKGSKGLRDILTKNSKI